MKKPFTTLDLPCHIVTQAVAQRGTTVAQRDTQVSNTLKTNTKGRLCHTKTAVLALKPLILLGETPLQRQLRMVCTFDRAAGSKPSSFSFPITGRLPAASKIAERFGKAAQLVLVTLALGSASHADGWASAAVTSGWSSIDRFGASPAPTQVSAAGVPSTPFVRAVRRSQGSEMDRLLALISQAESPVRGYDAVHHGATIRPPKPPSQMTIAEIASWVRATPGQPHAIGRNQIIPSTFNRVVRALGLSGSTVYDRRTQDMMGRFLIEEAGYSSFRNGRISRAQFMDNLAKVWAGLPMANGRSFYHGYAGNRATISRATFTAAMAEIFPVQRGSN